MSKYKIKVYNWNPNGTNDIAIVNSESEFDSRMNDSLAEALFGLDITKFKSFITDGYDSEHAYAIVPLSVVKKHIAVSPVSDGEDTVKFLKKYFKSA